MRTVVPKNREMEGACSRTAFLPEGSFLPAFQREGVRAGPGGLTQPRSFGDSSGWNLQSREPQEKEGAMQIKRSTNLPRLSWGLS